MTKFTFMYRFILLFLAIVLVSCSLRDESFKLSIKSAGTYKFNFPDSLKLDFPQLFTSNNYMCLQDDGTIVIDSSLSFLGDLSGVWSVFKSGNGQLLKIDFNNRIHDPFVIHNLGGNEFYLMGPEIDYQPPKKGRFLFRYLYFEKVSDYCVCTAAPRTKDQ